MAVRGAVRIASPLGGSRLGMGRGVRRVGALPKLTRGIRSPMSKGGRGKGKGGMGPGVSTGGNSFYG